MINSKEKNAAGEMPVEKMTGGAEACKAAACGEKPAEDAPKKYVIAPTGDYERLVPFFVANDLEFPDEEDYEVPTDLVQCWKVTEGAEPEPAEDSAEYQRGVAGAESLDENAGKEAEARGKGLAGKAVSEAGTAGENAGAAKASRHRLIGGFVLAERQGEFIVDGIAVDPEYREARLGKALLDLGIAETRKRGGKRIFLVARAPGFFRKSGFVTVPREEAPNFFECLTCPQYGVDCHPEVMRLDL